MDNCHRCARCAFCGSCRLLELLTRCSIKVCQLSSLRKVLITGAAGRIGQWLVQEFNGRYDLVLTDTNEPQVRHDFPFTQANLADLDALRRLCRGVDTIVHLAAEPFKDAPWENLWEPNVLGLYHVFQAAHEASCRRVVYASSINAVAGYPSDMQVHTALPPRPLNLYGATKVWGEAVASFYADQRGLSAICLRFGWVASRKDLEWPGLRERPQMLSMTLTYEDLARLVAASIDAPDHLRFGIYHGVSNNRWKRLDITDARRELGYEPQDDAFELIEHIGA